MPTVPATYTVTPTACPSPITPGVCIQTPYNSNSKQIQVTVTLTVNSLFGHVFGITSTKVSATAVAARRQRRPRVRPRGTAATRSSRWTPAARTGIRRLTSAAAASTSPAAFTATARSTSAAAARLRPHDVRQRRRLHRDRQRLPTAEQHLHLGTDGAAPITSTGRSTTRPTFRPAAGPVHRARAERPSFCTEASNRNVGT